MPDHHAPQRQSERRNEGKTTQTRPWHGVMRAWEVVIRKSPAKEPQRR